MRKFIGTIAIIIILYLGFFGCEKYNVKPFIVNWFKSDSPAQVKEKANKIKDIVVERDNVKEQTDSIVNKLNDKSF